jgi:hypothetical protein
MEIAGHPCEKGILEDIDSSADFFDFKLIQLLDTDSW